MTFNQKKKLHSKRSKKQPRKRQSSSKSRTIKPKYRRKFRMSNDNTNNFLQKLVIVTRDIGNLKNNDKNQLLNSIQQNAEEIKRKMEILNKEIEDKMEDDLDVSDLDQKLGANIIEIKWLDFLINSTKTYIDKLYDHILKDEYILPFLESEPDIENVKNKMIYIKNNVINNFWNKNMALRETKKEQFSINIDQQIEQYKNAHSIKKYLDNAKEHIQGLYHYKIKSKRKIQKNRASPYKVEKSKTIYNNKIRLLHKLSGHTPQKSSRKPIEGKKLRERSK
jgi:hypothetical protein